MRALLLFILLPFLGSIVHAQESLLTSHILDISNGLPAHNVKIVLEKKSENSWDFIENNITDKDGRVSFANLETNNQDHIGIYRLVFFTEEYFKKESIETFYPEIDVIFEIKDAESHYHVPITLSPFGYSTYRGS